LKKGDGIVSCPLEINFNHAPDQHAIRRLLKEKVDFLDHKFDGLHQCRVSVELPYKHRYLGSVYDVQLTMETQFSTDSVTRSPSIEGKQLTFAAVIRDAFNELEAKLASHLKKRKRKCLSKWF
jgi:ribosome-associated translation inhibitor RaiA